MHQVGSLGFTFYTHMDARTHIPASTVRTAPALWSQSELPRVICRQTMGQWSILAINNQSPITVIHSERYYKPKKKIASHTLFKADAFTYYTMEYVNKTVEEVW